MVEKSLKFVVKKFGGYGKKRTFALPFEKRVADKAKSSTKDWRRKIKNWKILEEKFGD